MGEYPNSIDDQFIGCRERMYELVHPKLKEELRPNTSFSDTWNTTKKLMKNLSNKSNDKLNETELRMIALGVYSAEDFHEELNGKMRTGRHTYLGKFGLISLHFLITDAIQTRNAEQRSQRKCQTTYRRSTDAFHIPGTFIRFGSFASSSLNSSLTDFGSETCFIITTCHGADISNASIYPDEAEVLIPPYERFKKEPTNRLLLPPGFKKCKLVYNLTSAGNESNMNCVYANNNTNETRSGGMRSGGMRSGGMKSSGMKSGGMKSGGMKSRGMRSGGMKSGGMKSGEMRSGGINSGGMRSGGMTSGGMKSGGINSGGMKSGEMRSGGINSGGINSGGMRSGGMTSGGMKSGEMRSGGMKTGGMRSGGMKTGGMRSGGINSGGMRSGGMRSGGMKSGGMRSGGMRSGGINSGGMRSGGMKTGGMRSGGINSGGMRSGGMGSGGMRNGGMTE
ncbi:hypothetical protein NFI96_007141 [Prochilodus magdalenae]|nr:hypothetical protein NFI96_007141 [Prochilodus magdalenae]